MVIRNEIVGIIVGFIVIIYNNKSNGVFSLVENRLICGMDSLLEFP